MSNLSTVSVSDETIAIDSRDFKLFGEDFYDSLDGEVMFANLTDRRFVMESVVSYPVWDPIDDGMFEASHMQRLLGIDAASIRKGRSSFSFEELPEHHDGITLIVEPDVAALGAKVGRVDLVAAPAPGGLKVSQDGEEWVKLVNICDMPVVYGADGYYETSLDPDPNIHAYFAELRETEYKQFSARYADYAVFGLPPRKNGTLYLARWSVAAIAHAGGRTDIVGIKSPRF